MTRPSSPFAGRPVFRPALALLLALAAGCLSVERLAAQTASIDSAGLRAQIEQRYDLLPLRDGVVLRPRSSSSGVRSIEVAGGAVAIDGQTVTGAELRSRLGTEADLILQLSYLNDAQRRALIQTADPASSPAAPAPSVPPLPPAVQPDVPEPPDAPRPPRRQRRGGDRVRFGGSVTVEEGESIEGDVVVIGGAARIDGQVTGDVVVVGGSLHMGPHADIAKDAVVVGGTLRREPGARVGGEVQEVGVGPLNLDWRFPRGPSADWWWRGNFGSVFSLVATIVRIGVLCLLSALVVMFARNYVEQISARAASEPLKAGVVGFLAQLLFVPLLVVTIVLFVITIVGIPLLILIPFGILALMVFALTGFTAVAAYAGRWFVRRFGRVEYGAIATTVIGVLLIVSPLLLARLVGLAGGPLWFMSMGLTIIGFLAEYVAWTVGLGAIALARFSGGGSTAGGGEALPSRADRPYSARMRTRR